MGTQPPLRRVDAWICHAAPSVVAKWHSRAKSAFRPEASSLTSPSVSSSHRTQVPAPRRRPPLTAMAGTRSRSRSESRFPAPASSPAAADAHDREIDDAFAKAPDAVGELRSFAAPPFVVARDRRDPSPTPPRTAAAARRPRHVPRRPRSMTEPRASAASMRSPHPPGTSASRGRLPEAPATPDPSLAMIQDSATPSGRGTPSRERRIVGSPRRSPDDGSRARRGETETDAAASKIQILDRGHKPFFLESPKAARSITSWATREDPRRRRRKKRRKRRKRRRSERPRTPTPTRTPPPKRKRKRAETEVKKAAEERPILGLGLGRVRLGPSEPSASHPARDDDDDDEDTVRRSPWTRPSTTTRSRSRGGSRDPTSRRMRRPEEERRGRDVALREVYGGGVGVGAGSGWHRQRAVPGRQSSGMLRRASARGGWRRSRRPPPPQGEEEEGVSRVEGDGRPPRGGGGDEGGAFEE